MHRPLPRPTRFPYTTLFRSHGTDRLLEAGYEQIQVRQARDELDVRVAEVEHDAGGREIDRSEEHTSELQSRLHLVCRLLLEKKKPAAYPVLGDWPHVVAVRC